MIIAIGTDIANCCCRILRAASITVLAVFVLSGQLPVPSGVSAHELPAVLEEYRLLSDNWELLCADDGRGDESYVLQVRHLGQTFQWRVEPAFIAQSLRGNEVPAQDDAAITADHVKMTIGKRGDLMFKLASLSPGGELFVRSIKLFDIVEAYSRASKFGSPILQMDGEQVRKLGSAKEYLRRVSACTERDWGEVVKRRRAK